MSFRWKLFLIFIIYGTILVTTGYYFITKINKETIAKETQIRAKNKADMISLEFKEFISGFEDKLRAIKESKLFQEYYELNDIISLQEYFLDIVRTDANIMQLRLLDNKGKEIIRVQRDSYQTHPYIIPVDTLQDKKNRYYVKRLLDGKKNTFWYSKLDLNIEYGDIQEPLEPVLRIGVPLYLENEVDAILIINIFMKEFLQHLTSSAYFDIYIIDKDGYILTAPEESLSWNRYLKEHSTKLFLTQKLSKMTAVSRELALNNGEELHVVVVPKKDYMQARLQESYDEIFSVIFIILIVSMPLSYFLSLIPARLNQRINQLNEELKKEQQEFRMLLSLFDLSDAVLFKWNNDASWSVNFVSRSVVKLLGYTKEEFELNNVVYANLIHKDDLPRVMEEVQQAIEHKKYFFKHEPYRVITKDKEEKWILDYTVVVRDEDENIIHFLGYLSDVSELKEKELMLKELARTDQLTKLYNRLYLDEVLIQQYYRFYRNNEACSVIMVDIDHFKEINDTYGHLVGDKVLVEFASILKNSVRVGDVVGRWGGEEFLLVLPYADIEAAQVIAKKLQHLIREHKFKIVNKLTASFGISMFKVDVTVEHVIDEADTALYKAKEAGRDRIEIYKAEKK
jgi:diguanylate cyclase (GGDEF)-like protein/PAS domain S-box-containing protein